MVYRNSPVCLHVRQQFALIIWISHFVQQRVISHRCPHGSLRHSFNGSIVVFLGTVIPLTGSKNFKPAEPRVTESKRLASGSLGIILRGATPTFTSGFLGSNSITNLRNPLHFVGKTPQPQQMSLCWCPNSGRSFLHSIGPVASSGWSTWKYTHQPIIAICLLYMSSLARSSV